MNDHDTDLERGLRDRYRSRAIDGAPVQLARRVLAIPATPPSRHGWLPRFINGGIGSMFNATRMVAALAVIALSGSVLLLGSANQEEAPVPPGVASETNISAAGSVAGTVLSPRMTSGFSSPPEGDITNLGNGLYGIEGDVTRVRWQADDQRLSGDGIFVASGIQHFDTFSGAYASAWTITNEDGGWVGTGSHLSRPDGGRDFVILRGLDGYDGLSAYVAIGQELPADEAGVSRSFDGVIFPGAPPTHPEARLLD